ncbi:MAG TPA: M48 family metallopeptidase [Chthoniobacterales bacterium]|nr:M48 family metallopeptidase [Chthoniobacterales bacterium]
MKLLRRLLICLLLLQLAPLSPAQTPSPAPAAAAIVPDIPSTADPATATRAWLDTVPADKRAKSDAYFEGGYWLILWNFLLAAAISVLLLGTRLSARIRDFAERATRFKSMQVAIYAVAYVLLISLLEFPLVVYEKFFREHAYGLATQTFGPWFSERLVETGIDLVASTILVVILYAVFRRAPKSWWLWGPAVVIFFFTIGILIAPIYIEPLFNKYKTLTNPALSEPILAMAQANQIPVRQVFEVDASRQSNRVSANVGGFLGTTRIALNDNLLQQCTLAEIRYVMAHEMGHYVLNHIAKYLVSLSLIVLISFALTKTLFQAAVRRWGDRWQVRGIADPAGLPLLMLIFGVISFLLTPVNNTITRVAEVEADAFGINTSREPTGMAQVALKLGTYRKLDPTPLEEFIFFDHPSGRARIRMAMDWKAAHLPARGE